MTDELRDIYAAPLSEFTSRRNTLARALRERGDTERAGEVARLRKPTLAAWAVNQLARERGPEIEGLVENARRLQNATDAAELRRLTQERHRLIQRLVSAAAEILEHHAHAATAPTLQEVSNTLYAATGDDNRDQILAGTLERPLVSTGFDQPFELSADAARYVPTPAESRAERELQEIETRLRVAEQEAEDLERAADRARLEADSAEARATQARRAVERLEEKRDRLVEKATRS